MKYEVQGRKAEPDSNIERKSFYVDNLYVLKSEFKFWNVSTVTENNRGEMFITYAAEDTTQKIGAEIL